MNFIQQKQVFFSTALIIVFLCYFLIFFFSHLGPVETFLFCFIYLSVPLIFSFLGLSGKGFLSKKYLPSTFLFCFIFLALSLSLFSFLASNDWERVHPFNPLEFYINGDLEVDTSMHIALSSLFYELDILVLVYMEMYSFHITLQPITLTPYFQFYLAAIPLTFMVILLS